MHAFSKSASKPSRQWFDQDIKRGEILINDEAKGAELVAEANQQPFVVSEVTRKERKRNPVPPFITSKCSKRLRANLASP